MTRSKFVTLTGFEPMSDKYKEIEQLQGKVLETDRLVRQSAGK